MTDFLNAIANLILDLDANLLLAINSLHAPWADTVMKTVSMRTVWIPFYLWLTYLLIRRYGWRKTLIGLLVLAVAITMVDQICGGIFRGLIARMRPANPDSPISQWVHIVDNYRGGSFGFPSCHAANATVVAAFAAAMLRRRVYTLILIAWILLMCWSRMYLGVHYPGDVLAGVLFGLPFGLGAACATDRITLSSITTVKKRLVRLLNLRIS